MISRILRLAILFILIFHIPSFAGYEDTDLKSKSYNKSGKREGKPKVFIEGIRLDFDFMRRNMQFVDFVNDPAVSDIHIIIASQTSGSGGRVYSLRFINNSFDNFSEYTLTCTTASSDTDEEIRQKIKDALTLGVMPFVNESEVSNNLSINYQEKQNDNNRVTEIIDPWNNWTFRGNFNGGFDAEESRKNYNYSVNFRADKITEDWKIRNNAQISVRTSKIEQDDVIYKSDRISNSFSSQYIKSLTPRWSIGAFVNYYRNNYSNFEYSVSAKPAIEYNIFPWDMSDRKVFTLAYYVGPEWAKYYEETIYDKFDEFLWKQTLRLNLQVVETWGEVDAGLSTSNYLHDFSKNRISFDTRLSVRIVRGISVNLRFDVERIHDEIYLPKEEVSLEDVLLNNKKLPSSFEIGATMGITIQFGSMYNNIVNNRL